jgi:polar amino acid transport system substrate-binding protein
MQNKFLSVILFVSVLTTLVGCTTLPTPAPVEIVESVSTAAPLPAPADNEVILTTGDWPPYVFETGPDKGPMADIVIAAFKEAGVTAKVVFYPWKRAEDEVHQGNAFAAFPYALTPERQKEFDFSDPLYTVKAKFFFNKKYHPDGMPFENLADLKNYKIGGLLGSWYEAAFKEAGLQVEYVSSTDQNVEKLARGRIDLMIEEENSVWTLIRQLYPNEADQFVSLEKPLVQPGVVNDLSLMISRSYPNSAELLTKFNAGLAAIRANGVYDQILEKYKLAIQ